MGMDADVGLGGVRDMGKIPNAVEVFGTPAFASFPWMALQEQVELQARNHSERENCAARRRCREFLEGGWGSIDWIDLYGQK